MVQQEINLYGCSVRDNLTLWNNTIPQRQIEEACIDACIHDVINALPEGYETILKEGGRSLSGGQRQRLEIARALVQNPSILLLDEATSALDPETEKLVDEAFRRRGCTLIIVAHRLSTIRDADQIIVMHKGEIVQRGRHDEMCLVEGSPYQQLLEESVGSEEESAEEIASL
jgi:ABC-type bacteriocin/lantibiotic exporter with double-glycine peptidase domain